MQFIRATAIIIFLPFLIMAQGSLLLVAGGGEDKYSWSDDPYGWFVEI